MKLHQNLKSLEKNLNVEKKFLLIEESLAIIIVKLLMMKKLRVI